MTPQNHHHGGQLLGCPSHLSLLKCHCHDGALCTKTKEESKDVIEKVVTSLRLTELVMHVCIDINIV
jgi:hypothetical protein